MPPKQSKLNFSAVDKPSALREPLGPVSPNPARKNLKRQASPEADESKPVIERPKKAKRKSSKPSESIPDIDDATPEPTSPSADKLPSTKKLSRSKMELATMTPAQAGETLDRLRYGYTDKSGSRYPAAVRLPSGCLIAQKAKNRPDDSGYVIMALVSKGTRGLAGSAKSTPPQHVSGRLVIIESGTPEDRENIRKEGWEASHLCHNPACIEETHIVAEKKADNDARKDCNRKFFEAYVTVGGQRISVLKSAYECPHEARPCIRREVDGVLTLDRVDTLQLFARLHENA